MLSSPESIEIEAMKKAGIGRAFIGNIWEGSIPAGPHKVLSDGWWEVMHAALKKATELDIEIGIFNCPGWSADHCHRQRWHADAPVAALAQGRP